jgi:hypothetical protein
VAAPFLARAQTQPITATLNSVSTGACSPTSCLVYTVQSGVGGMGISLTGTSGTITFEVVDQNGNYTPINVTQSNATSGVTSTAVSGNMQFQVNVAGYQQFRVRLTGAGSVQVVLNPSTASARSGGSGAAFGCAAGGVSIASCSGGFNVQTTGAFLYQVTNNAATGTGVNLAACDDGTGNAITCAAATSTTNQVLGFCVSNCGTTGLALVSMIGWDSVLFDGQTVARDYAISSSTVNGELHDAGATLTAGQPNFFIYTANTGAATVGQIRLLIADDFNQSAVATITEICRGTIALPTTLMTTGTKYGASSSAPKTTACSGMLTTDRITLTFNANVTGVTGYAPSATGGLEVLAYPDAGGGQIDLYLINDTANSITPGAATVNYQVTR